MRIFLQLILGLACLALILSVMCQSWNSSGLAGSIAGGAEQLFGKKKSKGYEAILEKITIASAVVFIILSLVLVMMG